MSRSIMDLDERYRHQFQMFWMELQRLGPFMIYDTLRTLEEQQQAFIVGASKCDGVRLVSPHQKGLAMDVVVIDPETKRPSWDYYKFRTMYKKIRTVANKHGLESGQEWPPINEKTGMGWDPPHVQVREV